jgi:catechol 2,3-dioxygenase-like lactoylglutathione lyase family enzyme
MKKVSKRIEACRAEGHSFFCELYDASGIGQHQACLLLSGPGSRLYLNLIAQPAERRWSWWGRVIFYVSDVDAIHQRALAAGYQPTTSPRDAEWGERFFHVDDPDGHELSFARPLRSSI